MKEEGCGYGLTEGQILRNGEGEKRVSRNEMHRQRKSVRKR